MILNFNAWLYAASPEELKSMFLSSGIKSIRDCKDESDLKLDNDTFELFGLQIPGFNWTCMFYTRFGSISEIQAYDQYFAKIMLKSGISSVMHMHYNSAIGGGRISHLVFGKIDSRFSASPEIVLDYVWVGCSDKGDDDFEDMTCYLENTSHYPVNTLYNHLKDVDIPIGEWDILVEFDVGDLKRIDEVTP